MADGTTEARPDWVNQQVHAFGQWCDLKLMPRHLSLDRDLEEVFDNGLLFIQLAEVLTDDKALKHVKKPKMRVQMIENITLALQLLEAHGFHSDTSAELIADHNLKMILGMIWQLFCTFQGGDPSAGDVVLEWAKSRVNDNDRYADVNVGNWTGSWNGGQAICALVDSMNPDLLHFPEMDQSDMTGNCDKAFDWVERELDVPRLVEANDMADTDVSLDDKVTKMYVTLIKEAWDKKGGAIEAELERRKNMTIDEVWAMYDDLKARTDPGDMFELIKVTKDLYEQFMEAKPEGESETHFIAGLLAGAGGEGSSA